MIKIRQVRKQIVGGKTYYKTKKLSGGTYSIQTALLEVSNGASLLKRIETTYAQCNVRTQLWLNHSNNKRLKLDYYNGGHAL